MFCCVCDTVLDIRKRSMSKTELLLKLVLCIVSQRLTFREIQENKTINVTVESRTNVYGNNEKE